MTPADEYVAWKALWASRSTSDMMVSVAREAASAWSVENDIPNRIRRRSFVRLGGNVTAEWTQPNTRVRGSLLYVHGAAPTGSVMSYRPLTARLAEAGSLLVLSLEFRRPPEYRFPTVINDVLKALRWMEARRRPTSRVILAGDSYGAMPVLSATMRLRAAGRPLPLGLYLLCPDPDWSNRSAYATRPRIADPTKCPKDQAFNGYFTDAAPCTGPDATPGLQDLTDLPPILLHESRNAPLTHALEFRSRLQEAGLRHTFQDWPETPHIFPFYGDQFTYTAEAMAAFRNWMEDL